jgi:hypothetical protein
MTWSKRPSAMRRLRLRINGACGIELNENTTDYPFPRPSDFGRHHPQAASL